MPIYEYRRPNGTTFEVMQKMTDDALTHDPETGVPVERVFHPVAVHFKGKGFYNTDYGTKKRAREKAESESTTKQDGAKAADSESGATKSEAKAADAPAPSSSSAGSSSSKGSSSPAGSTKD